MFNALLNEKIPTTWYFLRNLISLFLILVEIKNNDITINFAVP